MNNTICAVSSYINFILYIATLQTLARIQARIQGKAYRGYPPPPPKISKDYRVFGDIYIHVYIRTDISVNSYVTIIYLPLNSDFISIIQTLLGSSDL